MKQLLKILTLIPATITLTTTIYAEMPQVTPIFTSMAIVNDNEGMTDDYIYSMETGEVVVKSKESALMVNGEFVPYKGVMRNGTTFVPVRVISESFGKETKWNDVTQQVTVEDIVLTINKTTAKDGNTEITLQQAPFVENGTTYVPLRFIAESLDKEVGYVPKSTKNVYLKNSIVWVEDKELMDNNGYEQNEIIDWLKPQLYVNKNFFDMHGNTGPLTKEGIDNMTYLGQLGRYAVIDANADEDILVDMYSNSVYFYYAGMGYCGIKIEINDGEYYIYELDMTINLPEEFDGKYYIGSVQDSGGEALALYHKASADKEEGYGRLITIEKWGKEYSSHNPPRVVGGNHDLFSTPEANYMYQNTTDLQAYAADQNIVDDYFTLIDVIKDKDKFTESFNPIRTEKIPLDYPYKATEELFYGTWKVDKFLGFGEAFNDDTEQPNGFDIIGDEIVIEAESYITNFDKYPQYQYNDEYPYYEANAFGFENGEGVNFGTTENSQVIEIIVPGTETTYYVIDDTRLVMRVGDRTWYELKKVKAPAPRTNDVVNLMFFPKNSELEPIIENSEIDSWDKQEILKTWKVKKLVGFSEITHDDAEYPTGPNIVGKEIIMSEDLFSTMAFEGYEKMQKEIKNPEYMYTSHYFSSDSLTSVEKFKIPNLLSYEKVDGIKVEYEDGFTVPFRFYKIYDDKMYMAWSGGAIFELEPAN